MPKLSVISLTCTFALAQPTITPAEEIVALFEYHGDKTEFDILRGMLVQRVADLPLQVFPTINGRSSDSAQLANLKVTFYGPDTLENTDQVVRWMKNHGNILSTLQGTILEDTKNRYVVFTRFTLPRQVSNSGLQVVTVREPLTPDDFGNNRDSHTLMIIYALIQDAQRRGLGANYFAALFAYEQNLIADIARRSNGTLPADLNIIKRELDNITPGKSP